MVRLFFVPILFSCGLSRAENAAVPTSPLRIAAANADRKDPTRASANLAYERELVSQIYEWILKVEEDEKPQENYTETIPRIGASFDLISIPASMFRMGNPKQEKGRNGDEPNWREFTVSAFWNRLPTEDEWEYTCRAGTTGAFHCALEELADYAVFDPELTADRYAKVGTKKPNPWDLYCMHGNVHEWCPYEYSSISCGTLPKVNPWSRATQPYPRVVRGGAFYDIDPKYLGSARRGYSHPYWNTGTRHHEEREFIPEAR